MKNFMKVVNERYISGMYIAQTSHPTIADFVMLHFYTGLLCNPLSPRKHILGAVLDDYPNCKAHCDKMCELMKDYLATRPKNTM